MDVRVASPPLLLLTADGDPSITSTIALDEELTLEHWPHAIVTRDGGHGLVDADVAMAIVFFDRARGERFPLTPPLSSRPPRPITAVGSIAATDGTEDAPPSSLEVR